MSTQSTNLIERLFAAGAHFGFKKSRRHPTVVPYLFTSKDGSDVIDLEQTASQISAATALLEEAGKQGKVVLFVSTKDEMARLVKDTADKIGQPYVVNRWIGGMLTNWSEIKKRIYRLESLIAEKESGELDRKYTKKERVLINREVDKLQFNFGGIKTCTKIADMVVVVDPRHDHIAVKEAREMNVPVIGILSSDNNVALVDYPVIVNDALQSSVGTVLAEMATAYQNGKALYVPRPATAPRTEYRPRRPRTDA
jgi:small subunit ribosomal protein S2